jgi:colanic acid biosynthesis glycosyl transferase WcaI
MSTPVTREPSRLLYSGNLGVKQGLPGFISTFRALDSGWHLHIHGGGAEAPTLKEAIHGAERIVFAGVLEEPDYVAALRQATACLITQKPGTGSDFIPSKLLPALATGTPVLAVCEADTPLGREVKEGGFGVVLEPGDTAALEETLERWSSEPAELQTMSERALERARLYSRESVLRQYEIELQRLTSAPPEGAKRLAGGAASPRAEPPDCI